MQGKICLPSTRGCCLQKNGCDVVRFDKDHINNSFHEVSLEYRYGGAEWHRSGWAATL